MTKRFLRAIWPYFKQASGLLILGSLGGIVMNTAVVLPAILLVSSSMRRSPGLLFLAVTLAVIGACLNRWVMVLQTQAVPVLNFEGWFTYWPSWQEIATTILPVAYGVILISLSYRYLPIFPQEPELNPIKGGR